MMQTEQTEQTTSTNIVQATITPFSLSLPTDQEWLTPNLCLLRQQLEVFSATAHDVAERRTGTKPPLGSIGMRCKHCAHRREKKAVRGAVVYPASLSQIHQAVRNFHRHHFYSCPDIPDDVKERMRGFKKKENQSRRNAARYWIWSSREMLGMMDVDGAEGVSGSEGRTKAKVRRPHIRFRDGFVNGGTATTVGGGGGTSTRDSDTKGSTSTDRSITSTATGTNGPGPTNSAIPTTATASRAAAAAGATAADLTTCIGDGGRERIDSSTESVLSLAGTDSALEGIEDTDVDIGGVAIDDLLEHDLLTDTDNQTQVTRTTALLVGATADDDVAEESQVDEENNRAGANPTEEPRPERTDTNGPTTSAVPATASRAAAAGATAADLTTCIGDGGRERIDSSTESVLSLADSALEGIEDTDVDISGVAIDDLLEHDLLTDTSNQTQVTRTTALLVGATADDDVAEESQVDEENNRAGANPTEEPRPERTDTNGPTTSAVPATASRAAAAGATAADLTTCIVDVGRERIDSTESVLSLAGTDSALEGIEDVDNDISGVAIDDLLEHDLLTDDQTQVTRTTTLHVGATADDIDVAEESQVDEENNRAGANPTEEPRPERTDTNGPTTSAVPATASRAAAAGATAADLTTCIVDGGRERIDSTESVLSLEDSALEGIEDVDDDISSVAIDDLLEHDLLTDTDNQTQVTRTTALLVGATADDDVAEESQVDKENNRAGAGANPTEEPRPERRHRGSHHGARPATDTNGPTTSTSAVPATATATASRAAAGASAADLTTCIVDGGRERIDSTESVLSLAGTDSALEGIEDTDVDISGVAIDDLLEHDLLTDTSNQTQVTRTTCTTLGATADDIDVAEESQVDEENNQAGANPTEEPRPERTDTNGPTTSAVPATASRAAAAGATAADLTTCIGDVGRERIDSTESVLSLEDSALEGINDVDDDISSVAIDDLLEHDLLTDDQTQVTRTTCTTLGATADDIDVAEESQVDEENNRAGAGANPTEEPWPERRHRGSHHGAGPATDTNGPTTSAGPATASRAAAGATAADLTTCVGDGGRERIDSTESVLSLADSAALEGIEDVDDDISGVAIDDLLEHYLLSDTDNQTQVTRTTALGATADDDVAEESQVDEENNRAGANPTEEPRPERRHHGSYHGAGPECRNARNGRANIHNIWSSFAAASLPVSMEERTLPRMAAAAQRPQPKTANEERDYQMTLECQPAYTPLDEQEDIAALTIPDLYELQSDLSGITAGVAGINLNGGPSATKVVASDIARLDVEMSKLPPIHTAAYRQALEICPELISDERKMEFLECEDNDPALAATRLATHWNLRLEIFGPDRCFLPTTLAGAMQDEVDNMINRKVQQPLPVTDTAGRAIIFVSPARRNLDEYSMKQECMVAWYLLESFSQHPFVRKRGAVFIVDGRNYQRNFVSKYLKLFVSVMFRALPIKTRAYHLLSPSRIGRYFLEPVIRHFLDRDIRLRFKTHYGSLSRVLVDLQGYGLPRDRLPTEVGGTVVLDMKQWVMDRLALESSRLTQLPPTCTTELHSETHLPDKDITNPNRNASTSTSSQDKEKKRKQNRDADDSDDDSFLEVIKSLPGLGNDIDMDNDDVSL